VANKSNNQRYWQKHKDGLVRKNRERLANQRAMQLATIIHDPDPVGGFSAGSQVNCVTEMLSRCSFTINTVLSSNGNVYRVSEHLGKQRLVLNEKD